MKACVLHAVNDLRYEETKTPVPQEEDVYKRQGLTSCFICNTQLTGSGEPVVCGIIIYNESQKYPIKIQNPGKL